MAEYRPQRNPSTIGVDDGHNHRLYKNQVGGNDVHNRQRRPSQQTMIRQQSTGSCYSSRSFASNATGSTTKTHRRCSIEVGSLLFSPGCSEHTTEPTDRLAAAACAPKASAPQAIPRQVSSGSNASERRGPDSDRPVRCVGSHRSDASSKNNSFDILAQKHLRQDVNTLDAIELIRELSFFDTSSVPQRTKTSSSLTAAEELSTHCRTPALEETHEVSMDDEDDLLAIDAQDAPVHVMEGAVLPPLPPTSPPLPPKISRLGISHMPDAVPSQILHNRNRTRSTSISEMSGSYFNEFVLGDEDNESTSSGLSHSTSSREAIIVLDNEYLSSSLSHSTSSSKPKEGEHIMDLKKEALITIDNVPSTPNQIHRPVPLWMNRTRTSTIGSEQSSYFSSSSSSSDEFSISSEEDDEHVGHHENNMVAVAHLDEDPLFHHVTGHLSLQEGKCNAFCCDTSAEPSVEQPRLNSETLQRWTTLCEDQQLRKGIAKNQLIFRALSCPYNMNAAVLPHRSCVSNNEEEHQEELNDQEESVVVEEGPHLMAGISQVISQSLFSYTYTNSCAASTISSHNGNNHVDEVSDLDFDIGFILSYSIEKGSSVGTPLENCIDPQLNTKSHRRSRSSCSRLGKLPVLHNHDDAGLLNKTFPAPRHHRRFKSDGSIFCNKKQASILAQVVDFSLSEEPSFKNKFVKRHHRGKSLGSFKEQEIFDCSPLQCILEEASKSSCSANDNVDLVSFVKEQLDNMNSTSVLKLGLVLGLLVGVLFSHALNVCTSKMMM